MMQRLFKRMAEHERSMDDDPQPRSCMYLSGLAPGEELIPECEVIFEDDNDGLDSKFDWCEKNPKHKKFTPLCDFKMEDLPTDYRTDKVMNFIWIRMNLTVKIRIPYTTKDRPDFIIGQEKDKNTYPYMHHKGNKKFTRNGTGTVISVSSAINGTCPCHLCKDDKQPMKKYFLLTVRTVTHNVFNNEEARLAVVDCFFNNENDEEEGIIKNIYGLRIDESDGKKETMHKTDVCDIICVSHDVDTVERLSKLVSSAKATPDLPDLGPFTAIILSHPHGCTKRISIDRIPYMTIPLTPNYKTNTPTQFPEGTTKYKTNKKSDEIQIPSGMTFTLPLEAQYAMRYHFGNQGGYLSFPRGTKFTLPEGTNTQSTQILDDAEFEVGKGFSPEHYYACNIVGACAGTSGAMVYSNLMEDEVLTDMAHNSKLRSGKLSSLKTRTMIPE